MKDYDYWKSFISTGKIDDYLHYSACTQEEGTDDFVQSRDVSSQGMNISMLGIENSMASIEGKEGGMGAGIYYSNGDGSIGHAGWRL